MASDKNGVGLGVGSQVIIRATVRAVSPNSDGVNISLDTDEEMQPGYKVGISLNSKQVELAPPEVKPAMAPKEKPDEAVETTPEVPVESNDEKKVQE